MFKYDFGLSFAGEDREYAKELAERLKDENVRVFYDEFERSALWGKDLYQHFQTIYGKECRFFIPFVSKDYLEKKWPKHELRQAQAKDFKSDSEYILPLKIDDTELPGVNVTTGYIDLRNNTLEDVTNLCLEKLINDSTIRKLFIFLRNNNPKLSTIYNSKPPSVQIRVSTGKSIELLNILSGIDPMVCNGIDQHNCLINGGFGPGNCIPSNDPEPHTTFILNFSESYYEQIIV